MPDDGLAYAGVAVASLLVVAASVVLHYEGLVAIGRHYARLRERAEGPLPGRRNVLKVLAGLFTLHVAEIWLFGLTYRLLLQWPAAGSIDGIGAPQVLELVYFSAITFTTVGYGDVSPAGPIRFLAGSEALIGFMLITWSASFTYLHMARHWRDEEGTE
jgi:hypothetical protein